MPALDPPTLERLGSQRMPRLFGVMKSRKSNHPFCVAEVSPIFTLCEGPDHIWSSVNELLGY
jgi:hypothetical protein